MSTSSMNKNNFVSVVLTEMNRHISCKIIKMALKKFYDEDSQLSNNKITHTNECKYTTMYINVCAWLIEKIESLINEMIGCDKYTITREYTNDNFMHELAFSTNISDFITHKNYEGIIHLAEWEIQQLDTPFNLIQNELKERGFIMDVSCDIIRNDLYAPLTTIYTLKLCRSRFRSREE